METIGKYEVKNSSPRDGLSLHEAVDPADGHPVSIRLAQSESRATALFREVQNLDGLSHPALPKILELNTDGNGIYAVEDFQAGCSLKERLQKDSVRPETAWTWIEQTASALDYLHEQGVIHRNITSETIWVGENGSVQLRGFDLASRLNASAGEPEVQDFLDTIGYQAPEFLLGDAPNGASDQFSLAAVAVECLTGKGPFAVDGPVASSYETIFGVPKLDALEERFSGPVFRVCERALAKSGARRFATCAEFAKALEAGLSGKAASETRAIPSSQRDLELAEVQQTQRAKTSPAAVPSAVPNYAVWAAGVAAVLAVVFAIYWFTKSAPIQPAPSAAPIDAFKSAAKSIVGDSVPTQEPTKRPAVTKKPSQARTATPTPTRAPETPAPPAISPPALSPTPPPTDRAKAKAVFSEPTVRKKEN